MPGNKLIIIGLDGGTFNFIDPLMEKGELPNIEFMIKNGVRAELESTKPPVTCPAWPSFMTGLNPGKHGATGFVIGKNKNIVSYDKIEGEKFWDMLAEKNKKSIIVNVPITYPPKIKDGIMISCMLTPPDKNFCYPPQLNEEIKKNVPGYVVGFDLNVAQLLDKKESWNKFNLMIEKRYALFKYLLDTKPWDLGIVVFSATDIISHKSWDNRSKINDVYSKIDKYIGELLKIPKTNFMVISDHGFGDFKKYARINQLFENEGLLKRKKGITLDESNAIELRRKAKKYDKFKISKVFEKLGLTKENIYVIFGKKSINFALKIIPPHVAKKIIPESSKQIDYENTKAYLIDNECQGIKINATNEEKEEIICKIINLLTNLTDEGLPVIKNIYRKEDIFSGKYINSLPDIYLEANEYFFIKGFGKQVIEEKDFNFGKHWKEGILIAFGPDIQQRKVLPKKNIIDIAPTVLHLFNIKENRMDGKIIKDLFKISG